MINEKFIKIELEEHKVKILKDLLKRKIDGFQWVIDNKKPDLNKKTFLKMKRSELKDILATIENFEEE